MRTFIEDAVYNTKEGLVKSLESLKAFNDLLHERHVAGYERKESLEEFIVKGKWVLDSCGNCGEIQGDGVELPEPVMLLGECREKGLLESISYSMGHSIPPNLIVCPICGNNWTAKNMGDSRCREGQEKYFKGSEIIPGLTLTYFAGRTLDEVRGYVKDLHDASYWVRSECNIRNDKNIDLTPLKDYKTLKVNERGWINAKGDYVIKADDEVAVSYWVYYHAACLSKKVEADAQAVIDSDGKGYDHLYNLAGNENCDYFIKAELTLAGIDMVQEKDRGEVPAKIKGKLGNFKFSRAWTYWIVKGDVPLSVAEELYADPVGVKYVRVAGHCGCPAPKEWATPNEKGELVVDCYHIDTLPGLRLFAEKVRGLCS